MLRATDCEVCVCVCVFLCVCVCVCVYVTCLPPPPPISLPSTNLPDHTRSISGVVVSPLGNLAAMADQLGRVLLLEAETMVIRRIWKGRNTSYIVQNVYQYALHVILQSHGY